MTSTIVSTLVLCAPLILAGCASSPNRIAWIDEAPSTEYTVVPERESFRRVPVTVYESRPAVYTWGPLRFYYRPAPTVTRQVVVVPSREVHRHRDSGHHQERRKQHHRDVRRAERPRQRGEVKQIRRNDDKRSKSQRSRHRDNSHQQKRLKQSNRDARRAERSRHRDSAHQQERRKQHHRDARQVDRPRQRGEGKRSRRNDDKRSKKSQRPRRNER